jgi:hypothetical protein
MDSQHITYSAEIFFYCRFASPTPTTTISNGTPPWSDDAATPEPLSLFYFYDFKKLLCQFKLVSLSFSH